MSTIEQIDHLLEVAKALDYRVRYDYLGGTGGGVCEFSGKKFIFIDLALTSQEQLEVLRSSLANDARVEKLKDLPKSVAETLRKSMAKRVA